MNERNYSNPTMAAAVRHVRRGEMFYKDAVKNMDSKKLLWTMLHFGGFLFVASILFLLVMLIVTS